MSVLSGGVAVREAGAEQRTLPRRVTFAAQPAVRLATLMASFVAACGGSGQDDGTACTAEVRPSVIVRVSDAAGAPLAGATVTYRVDGGPQRAAVCHEPPAACSTFYAGEEVSGEFSLTAERARFQSASAVVKVERDVCHVLTQQVTLVLRPV